MSDQRALGVLIFALGGALLLFAVYYIIGNVNKPWIDVGLFAGYFVLPLGFIAFALLGLGLLLITKPSRSEYTQTPARTIIFTRDIRP